MIENLENEIWKDVVGYEGLYQISNFGRVKSLERSIKWGTSHRVLEEKIKTYTISGWGYCVLSLCKDSRKRIKQIHRLVALAFIPNPESKCDVNHINGIKTDNRLENLEWATRSENLLHAYRIGLSNVSEKSRLITIERSSKKVVDMSNGKIYKSAKLASEDKGIEYIKLLLWLKNKRPNKSTLRYNHILPTKEQILRISNITEDELRKIVYG